MQIVLAVIGWILLALLLVLVLALVLPVFLHVTYEKEQLTIKMNVLFFSFVLYPAKEKQKPEKVKTTQQLAEEEKPKKKKKLPYLYLEDIVALVVTAGKSMHKIFRALRITKIGIVLPVHGDDPAKTAIQYGQMHAYLGGAIATLQNFLTLQFQKVQVIADFEKEFSQNTYFYCKIGATPIILLIVAIYALVRVKRDDIL